MKDIDIASDCARPPVLGDAILLQNALRNVLDNAIKYSPAETAVTVDVRRWRWARRASPVSDQGRGFGDWTSRGPDRPVHARRATSATWSAPASA